MIMIPILSWNLKLLFRNYNFYLVFSHFFLSFIFSCEHFKIRLSKCMFSLINLEFRTNFGSNSELYDYASIMSLCIKWNLFEWNYRKSNGKEFSFALNNILCNLLIHSMKNWSIRFFFFFSFTSELFNFIELNWLCFYSKNGVGIATQNHEERNNNKNSIIENLNAENQNPVYDDACILSLDVARTKTRLINSHHFP